MARTLNATRDHVRLALIAAQGLDARARRKATKASVLDAIRRMGVLQIDTIHVVARSPYLVLWSRVGDYPPQWLEELLDERQLFEYWAHEASFVPIEDFALYRHRMKDPRGMGWKYSDEWVRRNHAVMDHVRATVREKGPVRSADFERKDGKGGGWWGWKPEKRALELLLTAGELMVVRRERFQRVYDLRERALPDWDDASLGTRVEAERTLVLKAAAALGIATERWLADYFRMPRRSAAAAVKSLVRSGDLREVAVDDWKEPAYVDRSGEARLGAAREGRIRPSYTTILSPFDPIVWDRARASAVFDFDYRIECYTPAAKRQYGYFVLPILRRGRLVGRLDAKAHRRDGRFEIIALYLEAGVRPSDALARDIAGAVADLAAWHETPDVEIRRTVPGPFLAMLRRAIRSR